MENAECTNATQDDPSRLKHEKQQNQEEECEDLTIAELKIVINELKNNKPAGLQK